jgi:hypothetical protein
MNPLVAFYDIHGRKREVLFFYFVPDTTRDCEVTVKLKKLKTQNTLFSLGMLTNTYELQDIIQIALKRLPGGGGVP